ncbi:unnamed protein product, partial [Tilletia laevis]
PSSSRAPSTLVTTSLCFGWDDANGSKLSLADTLAKADAAGKVGAELGQVEKEWMDGITLKTWDEGTT